MLSIMSVYYAVLICIVVLSRIEAQTKKPRIYFLHVKSDIRYRFATTVVTSKVVNPDLTAHESTFDVTLPNEAFISNFTLTVGNEVYVGNVTTKETAQQVYEKDRSQGKSAAQVSVKPRETNTFNIQINVAADDKVTFELRYQELLQRKLGAYSHLIYLKPGEPVADLRIEVDIDESRNITNLKIPPIKSNLFTIKDQKDADAAITITRPSPERAHILFQPSLNTQTAGNSNGLDCQFKVKYDIDRNFDGGDLLMVNGYFVHFFAPSGLPPKPKDVVFILDKSGSMRGRKMAQLKKAMSTILSQIQSEDRLNILTFSSSIYPWEMEAKLLSASPGNIERADTYVKHTLASGGTNIDGALRRGVALLDERKDKTRAPVLIFLTDGEPTVGQRNPEEILKNVMKFNEDNIPIFSLAFGGNADYKFIKRLAAQNNGFGRKIYEDADAALQISDFYSEISAVLLQNVTFRYLPGSVDKNTLTKTIVPNMFQGSEVVVAGKMANALTYDIKPNVIATDSNGLVTLDVPTDGVIHLNSTLDSDSYSITEKIWAYLTIKQWIQKRDGSTDETEQGKLKQNIITMALKYNFVTPFTSMVVSLPDKLQSSAVDLLPDSPESVSSGSRFTGLPMATGQPVQMARSFPPARSRSFFTRSRSPSRLRKFGNRRMSPVQNQVAFSQNSRPRLHSVGRFNALKRGSSFGPLIRRVAGAAKSNSNSFKTSSQNTGGGSSLGVSPGKTRPVTTPHNRNTMKSTTPQHESTSGYTLGGIKGIELPLCLKNPSQADEAKRYTLFRDIDTGTRVKVRFTHSQDGTTRINYVTIDAKTVTELFPTHLVENGVRHAWNSNTFFTYVQGSRGSGVKLEVTSLNNNRLIVNFNFTENTSENIEGSLALPINGTIKDNPNLNTFPNSQIKELSLLAKKLGSVRLMMIPVELSTVMKCWVVRSTLPWVL
ncbi:inter-alpha-trypsin inhibitor heavy chain H3-like [Pecten maximus]|uniref:inter-alpha-trypsin inhibitor heavy chain H3-like n=1 Tax=Pecten maximus TaxID=6579 RepID=UPI001458A848|nr:inter-alpha-trypsin inhibitor heavy chain H3-like [Pecten maximus]